MYFTLRYLNLGPKLSWIEHLNVIGTKSLFLLSGIHQISEAPQVRSLFLFVREITRDPIHKGNFLLFRFLAYFTIFSLYFNSLSYRTIGVISILEPLRDLYLRVHDF